jgi:Uma2 family endonuclease
MATHRSPIEPDDLLEIPVPDELSGYELVDGELAPVTPASRLHGKLIWRLGVRLQNYIDEHCIVGELYTDSGFVLGLKRDPRRLRGPDVSFVGQQKLLQHGAASEHFARFVPDLAVEIDLASGRKPGGLQRIRDYVEAGVPLIWAIHPRTRTASVYRRDGSMVDLDEHDVLNGEDVIPGFLLPLNTFFE